MKKNNLRLYVGIILWLAVFPVTVMFAAKAVATPADNLVHDAAIVCALLAQDSTPWGVARAFNEFDAQGVDEDWSKAVAYYSLTEMCPWYRDELEAAYEHYFPTYIA